MVWLDNSRIIATFAVVFLHVAGFFLNAGMDSQYWWFGNIFSSFSKWCIPVFVMISGALLLSPDKTESMETFYRKRVSKIFIPILFWSMLYSLGAQWQGILNSKEIPILEFLNHYFFLQPTGHMWFFYMIIPLYLLTPFFRKIVANSTRREIFKLVVLSFMIAIFASVYDTVRARGYANITNWFYSYIPYYFLGYLIRTDKRCISKTILWSVFLFSSCLTTIGYYILSSLDAGTYFYGYLSVTVIPASVSIMYLLKFWTKPIINDHVTRTLSLLTLGIYLIHPFFWSMTIKSGYITLDLNPAVSVPVTSIIIFSVSLIVVWCIYKVPYLKRII